MLLDIKQILIYLFEHVESGMFVFFSHEKMKQKQIDVIISNNQIQLLCVLLTDNQKMKKKFSSYIINRSLDSPFYLNSIQTLFNQNLVEINCKLNYLGWTILHKAAYEKNWKLMKLLINYDVDLTRTDFNGNTALHLAIQSAQKNRTSNLHILNDQTIYNNSNNVNICEFNQKSKDEKFYFLDVIRLLIEKDMKINCTQEEKFSNFHSDEIYDSKTKVNCKLLVNKKNIFSKTALHYATQLKPDTSTIKLIEYLLENKANPDQLDIHNRTPIYYLLNEYRACVDKQHYQRLPFIQLLLKFKCDPLNLNEIRSEICSLKQLTRKIIKKNCANIKLLHDQLPFSLICYLSREIVY